MWVAAVLLTYLVLSVPLAILVARHLAYPWGPDADKPDALDHPGAN